MFSRYDLYKQFLAHWITSHWPWIVGAWVILALVLRGLAPPWNSIAKDGDFEFLPSSYPSRVGQRLLDEAFPAQRARSRLVLIAQRTSSELRNEDLAITYDLGRRLLHLGAKRLLLKSNNLSIEELNHIKGLLDAAIQMDGQWFDAVRMLVPDNSELLKQRTADAYLDRALIFEKLNQPELAKQDREKGGLLAESSLLNKSNPWLERVTTWNSLLDVWTWEDALLGSKLGSGHPNARLIVLQLDNEFMAVGNVPLMEATEKLVEDVKQLNKPLMQPGFEIGISGPSAVGADMLRAARSGVEQTEWISICMVLLILAVIYRGPVLVCIPLITILLSLSVAMSVLALLGRPFWGLSDGASLLKIFSTTRIFLVVLLFGIGTDFCLFLVSRSWEAYINGKPQKKTSMKKAVAISWIGVHDALVGSAFTTAIGLVMMYFSDFEKFSYSGLAIGLAILITLLVCLTFTPALLCGLGQFAFWPLGPTPNRSTNMLEKIETKSSRFWKVIAELIIARPRTILVTCLVLLCIPALQGLINRHWVTYDFLKELSWSAPSRKGARLIDQFFSTRDNSPVTVVMVAKEPLTDVVMREAINRLRTCLYLPEVTAVRALTDPLGDYPPDRRMGLFSSDAWKRRMLENHRLTQTHYVALQDRLAQRAARFDVLLSVDPFSVDAENLLNQLQTVLESETKNRESPWYQATFACTGTTAGIADLKKVTQADQARIQILVTFGVWLVLCLILRKPWFSAYLMFTVLLSYLTTLGLTQWFFWWAYGSDFVGLDWKVPFFLFVILVAVGQDYNVYLATRIFEEQAKHGPIQGLFRAMVTTGGIITSCGLVMAATFLSMTGSGVSAWLGELGWPTWLGGNGEALVLRGIVELGFALGLGVLIDTLLVRTVLVPAMFVWLTRLQKA